MNRLPNLNIEEMAANGQLDKSGQTPKDLIVQAEADMNKANQEELDYYAPMHLAMAETHLKKAQNALVNGGDEATVTTEAAFARKVIEKGLMVKQAVLRQLDDVFAMKTRLDAIKTEVYYRDEYNDQLDHIKKLIQYIEKGDQDALVKKKGAYLAEMRTLEVNVVKKKTLTEPMDFLTKARNLDAKELSPKTLKTAEDTMARATVFIESYPRDDKGVGKVGLEALRACQHVFYVTKEVITIKSMDKNEYEDLVLGFENKLHRITQSLGESDVRHMSLEDQSITLSNTAEELKRKAGTARMAVVQPQEPPKETSAPVAQEDAPAPTLATSEDQAADNDTAMTETASDEPVGAQTVSDPEEAREDLAHEELDAETAGVSQAETVSETQEEQADDAADERASAAVETAALASSDQAEKHDEPPVDNAWDGSVETFNMEDLYLSDEERAKLRNK